MKIGYCKTMDNKILIESISGVMTMEEIEDELGEEVLRLYEQGNCLVLSTDDKIGIKTFEKKYSKKYDIFEIGDVYEEERFNEIIEFFKICALRLDSINKTVQNYTQYEVII